MIRDINNSEEEIKLKGFSFLKWICRIWLPSQASVRSISGSPGGHFEQLTLRHELLCRIKDTKRTPSGEDALLISKKGELQGVA